MQRHSAYFQVSFLGCLVLVAAFLSFTLWMPQSIRLDEAQSIWQTSRSLGGVFDIIAKDVHVPVYFFVLHYWEVSFGTTTASIRTLSLFFFLLSIPAIFCLALEMYSEKVAYFVASITALSPFMNWYGSEARMYSLLFLLSILSHLYFIRIWKTPSRSAWAGYTVYTFLGVFTHLFFCLIPFSQALFFFIKRRTFSSEVFRRLTNIAAVLIVCIIGWFVYRHFAGAGLTDPLLARPTSVDFFNTFSNFFIGFQSDRVNTVYLSLWPLAVLVGFTFLARKRLYQGQTVYLLISSLVPIVLAFGVSLTVEPVFLSRYLVVSLPALYILAVYYLSLYEGKTSRVALCGLIAVMTVMLVVQALEPLSPVKEDFRSATEYVSEHATASDIFVVSAPLITYPVEYYYTGSARLVTFPRWDRFAADAIPETYSKESLVETTSNWSKTYRNVYLLLGYDQGYEQEVRLYMDTHYERTSVETFSPNLSLYVYKLRYL